MIKRRRENKQDGKSRLNHHGGRRHPIRIGSREDPKRVDILPDHLQHARSGNRHRRHGRDEQHAENDPSEEGSRLTKHVSSRNHSHLDFADHFIHRRGQQKHRVEKDIE